MLLRFWSHEVGSDVCWCRTLGRRSFFANVKRSVTRQVELFSFGHRVRNYNTETMRKAKQDQGDTK